MVEQGYNYLGNPIHSMPEFFETTIKNLEKSIPPSIPSRNKRKSKKVPKKRNAVTFDNSQEKDLHQRHIGKKFLTETWHVRTYHGSIHHAQGTSQADKAEKERTI